MCYLYYNSPYVCLSVCLSVLANCRSQFLLDRLGRCLKLFVSTCNEFASQFGLDICIRENPPQISRKPSRSRVVYLNEVLPAIQRVGQQGGVATEVTN